MYLVDDVISLAVNLMPSASYLIVNDDIMRVFLLLEIVLLKLNNMVDSSISDSWESKG